MNKDQLVEELSKLTVLELAELKEALEEKWNVTAMPAAAAVVPGAAAPAEAADEATDFEVILKEVPAAKKLAVIKLVRELTGLGLKEAKELTEAAPKAVKEKAAKEEAEKIKKDFEAAGAVVELKAV